MRAILYLCRVISTVGEKLFECQILAQLMNNLHNTFLQPFNFIQANLMNFLKNIYIISLVFYITAS